jgi:hypothetical protein
VTSTTDGSALELAFAVLTAAFDPPHPVIAIDKIV